MNTLRWMGIVLAFVAVGGCTLMPSDFDKATEVARFSLGHQGSVHRVIALPAGQAELVVAVPNYHCKPAASDDSVRVRVTGENVTPVDVTMTLGDLTWGYAVNSCDAYGYLYDRSAGLSRKFQVPDGAKAVSVDVDVSSKGELRPASVWLIYGGRVPTNRVFGHGHP